VAFFAKTEKALLFLAAGALQSVDSIGFCTPPNFNSRVSFSPGAAMRFAAASDQNGCDW
jgi:hypothetical protein